MNGYDKNEALPFILSKIEARLHKDLPGNLEDWISQAIDADMAYMHSCGVIDESGDTGDAYYDDDDAFEYMLDTLVSKNKLDADTSMKLASLLDDYMDAQQAFMEQKGLVAWE